MNNPRDTFDRIFNDDVWSQIDTARAANRKVLESLLPEGFRQSRREARVEGMKVMRTVLHNVIAEIDREMAGGEASADAAEATAQPAPDA